MFQIQYTHIDNNILVGNSVAANLSLSTTTDTCILCSSVTATSCLVDFAFLVDSSGSICNNQGGECENWRSVRSFLQQAVRDMKIEQTQSRIGMILFGSYADVVWQLDT